MRGNVRDTLILPFKREILEAPAPGTNGVFLGAQCLDSDPANWTDLLICEQHLRGEFLELQRSGFTVHPEISSGNFDFAFILAGKHKRLNEQHVRRAAKMVRESGKIIIAGNKTDGISPLRKFVSGFAAIGDSLSKNHATVFWFENSTENRVPEPEPHLPPDGYFTIPGMFSADHVDPGSAELAAHIDRRVSDNIADFGAGWGYLSRQLLERAGKIHHLDLYEADWKALEFAKKNLSSREVRLEFFWHDLVSEKVGRTYDWVVMNPPFHEGRKADPGLGRSFIEVAAKALKRNGRLLMVANRNLPYEKIIEQQFASHSRLVETSSYKIIEAIR